MSKISYMLNRLTKMDYKRMWSVTGTLKERSGKSRLRLMSDMFACAARYNAGYMDYMIARMWEQNDAQRRTVLTRGINNSIVRRMNDKAHWHAFDDKAAFNRLFSKWVQRGWIEADESTPQEALEAFLKDKNTVFIKPLEGSSGQGIKRCTADDWSDMAAFVKKVRSLGKSIIEEGVVQHPRMSALYPGSVNTVRIATLIGEKKEGIVYAFLRIGNGKIMDNVDCGGMAARVDLDSGRLLTVAADKAGNTFTRHPITDTPIIGFELPGFEDAKEMCLEAMRLVPAMRYIAWDVALTEEGPTLIEGNSFPSHAVPQFAAHYPDKIGILPEFEKFIDI